MSTEGTETVEASVTAPSDEGDAPTVPAGTYKLGLDVPETGPLGFAGVQILGGAQAAVDAINASGRLGEGVTIELDKIDDASDPAQAVAAMNTFAGDDVLAVACCYTSGISGPVKPVALENDLILLGGGAAIPDWPEPPLINRIVPLNSVDTYGRMMANYLEANAPESVTMILASDNPGMVGDGEGFIQPLNDTGIEIDMIEISDSDTDFAGPATDAVANDPDLMIVQATRSAVVIKALRDSGYDGPVVSNAGLSTPASWEQSGGTLHDVYYPENLFLTLDTERGQAFNEAFEAATGTPADTFASYGWMQVEFFADVLAASDGTEAGFAQVLAGITEFDSIWGPMVLENGQGLLTLDTPTATFGADGAREVAPF